MSGNKHNFRAHDFDNDVDKTNLVDGKPIYYIKNVSGITIDNATNAGTIYCMNCENITVKDMILTNNGAGVCFYKTNNSRIENVKAVNCSEGIGLRNSHNNTLKDNYASNSHEGIYMGDSDNNVLKNNIVLNNSRGICLYSSNNSLIYLNNFVYNSLNFYSHNSINTWNSTSKITCTYNGSAHSNYLGNHWDDYKGTDEDDDGIGDTPYIINGDKDNYPLMTHFEYYFASPAVVPEVSVSEMEFVIAGLLAVLYLVRRRK